MKWCRTSVQRSRSIYWGRHQNPDHQPQVDFAARIRDEATGSLASPIAGWLPEDEAAALRAAFRGELDRLYAVESPADPA